MSVQTIRRDAPAYTRTPSKQELIAEAVDCILGGRPYPPHLGPTTHAPECPATVEQGIARILAGPQARLA